MIAHTTLQVTRRGCNEQQIRTAPNGQAQQTEMAPLDWQKPMQTLIDLNSQQAITRAYLRLLASQMLNEAGVQLQRLKSTTSADAVTCSFGTFVGRALRPGTVSAVLGVLRHPSSSDGTHRPISHSNIVEVFAGRPNSCPLPPANFSCQRLQIDSGVLPLLPTANFCRGAPVISSLLASDHVHAQAPA